MEWDRVPWSDAQNGNDFKAADGSIQLIQGRRTGIWTVSIVHRPQGFGPMGADAAKAEAVAIVRKWCQDILADLGD